VTATYAYTPDPVPAPYVTADLALPGDPDCVVQLPALVDTGADRTIVPEFVPGRLGATPAGQKPMEGFAGPTVSLPLYWLQVRIHGLPATDVLVAACQTEPFILLGRDVLNRFRIVLDGPAARLELG
jgi:predicted aspartyl protease